MTDLTYVSLFSGIEAFSVAASRIEGVRWHPVFFSEIDPFPCAALAHHFPSVPNLGDICKIRVDREKGTITNGDTTVPLPRTGIDIIAGGPPCQSLSVAGLRHGMQKGSGTRSSLFWEYARLVEELHPRVVLYENVPGVLSSRGGRDFYALQCALVQLGYSLAYRVLDAQYARVDGFPLAVPQRRRRVWLVGCLGADESVPAKILFERPCVLGDTPPRRTQGQGSASPPGYRSQEHDRVVGGAGCLGFVPYGTRLGASPEGIIQPLTHIDSKFQQCVALRTDAGEGSGTGGSLDVAAPLCAADGKGKNGMDICGKVAVVPLSDCLTPGHPQTHRVYRADGVAYTLDAGERSGQDQRAVLVESASFDGADVSATLHKPNGTPGYSDQEVFAQQGAYLARVATFENHGQDSRVREIEVSDTRSRKDGTGGNNLPLVVFTQNQREEVRDFGDASGTLPAEDGSHQRTIVAVGADGYNQTVTGNVSKTLGAASTDYHHVPLVCTEPATFGKTGHAVNAEGEGEKYAPVDVAQTLNTFQNQSDARAVELVVAPSVCKTLSAEGFDGMPDIQKGNGMPVVAIDMDKCKPSRAESAGCHDQSVAIALDKEPALNHIVRRLTPVECERLMGFPDGWTKIPWRIWQESHRKGMSYEKLLNEHGMKIREPTTEECPDSPRYKALGNSWATNCAEWVLRRIVSAETLGMIPFQEDEP